MSAVASMTGPRRCALATTALLAMLTLAATSGCGNMSKQDQNTAVGAAVGGVAGAILSGGGTAGTVGGAAVGGIIGNQLPDKDKK